MSDSQNEKRPLRKIGRFFLLLISSFFQNTLLLLIRVYQYTISPLLGTTCRFYPSCSTYSYEAICKHGLGKGLILCIQRLLKCHPWNDGGHDPVP